jgi:hypothetical protein
VLGGQRPSGVLIFVVGDPTESTALVCDVMRGARVSQEDTFGEWMFAAVGSAASNPTAGAADLESS